MKKLFKKFLRKTKQLFCIHDYQDNKYLAMMGLKGKMCVKCYKGDKINFEMS